MPLGKIQIEFWYRGFSSQIRLLKNSNMQERLFVRQFFFSEKMVKYHPWHYGKESSDKTFFHMGENYHYSFNFNYLSTLDFLIIMCPVSLTFTKKRKKMIIWNLINFSHQKWVALISFFHFDQFNLVPHLWFYDSCSVFYSATFPLRGWEKKVL